MVVGGAPHGRGVAPLVAGVSAPHDGRVAPLVLGGGAPRGGVP